MNALYITKRLVLCLLLCSLTVIPAHLVRAISYQVTAQIPYPVPSSAPTIENIPSSAAVGSLSLNLQGTCEVMTPSTIVSIWRNGMSIGSTVCQVTGTYSLTIQLVAGTNTLLPRQSNISEVFGPDGASYTTTYQPPPNVTAPPIVTSSPPPSNTSSNVALPSVTSDLSITSVRPFGLLSEKGNSITVEIVIRGTGTPFQLGLNWGDGTTESKQIALAGTYSFSHTYEKSAVYTLRTIVTDVLGAEIEYSIPIVPTSIGTNTSTTGVNAVASANKHQSFLPYFIGGVAVLIATSATFFAGERYVASQNKKHPKKRRK